MTRVGERLAVAVLNFEEKGEAKDVGESLSEKLVSELVNLRRFKVIEREKMKVLIKEQKLGMIGVLDEDKAVEMGKMVGADVIVLGSINIATDAQLNVRLIDTETGEIIVARDAQNSNTDLSSLNESVKTLAIDIYNDLPLVEGEIVMVEGEDIILDIGTAVQVRKGTKYVAFLAGKEIKHPRTGAILGQRVEHLGELIVLSVQERMSTARMISGESDEIEVGNRVLVK